MPDREIREYKCNQCGYVSRYAKDIYGGNVIYENDKPRPCWTRNPVITEYAGPDDGQLVIQPQFPERLYICPQCSQVQARGYELVEETPAEVKPEPKKRGRKKTHA